MMENIDLGCIRMFHITSGTTMKPVADRFVIQSSSDNSEFRVDLCLTDDCLSGSRHIAMFM